MSCIFFSRRRRHTRLVSDWSSDVCSSDLRNGCYAKFLKARMARLGVRPDDPDLDDQMYSVTYRGLRLVFVGERSEERRVGKVCRYEWGGEYKKKSRLRREERVEQ